MLNNQLDPIIEPEDREFSLTVSRLFNTPDGQVVMGWLGAIFMEQVKTNTDHAFQAGRISVIQDINRQIMRAKHVDS